MKLESRIYARLVSPFRGTGVIRSLFSTHTSSDATSEGASETSELVRRIYHLARSGETSVGIWRDCTLKTIDFMNSLDLKGLCSILHSYGYMKYRDRHMLELISARLVENVRRINSAQISTVLRAYSILNFRSDFLFRLMIPEISLRLDMMNVGQVASIFYSYSNLGYYNSNLFRSIQSFLYQNLERVAPYDLTLLLGAHCKNLRGFDERFLTVLSFQFCKLLDSYDNKLFALSVNSLSRLGFCGHKYLPGLVESEVYNRLKMSEEPVPSKSLALILNALTRHRSDSTPLFAMLAQMVSKRIKEFDIHSLCLTLTAFSRVSLPDGKIYDRIAEHVGRSSLALYPRAVASMLYSYGRARHLHGALFYFAGKHLELNLGRYSCDELAMILRSFALLNVKNVDVLAAAAEFILANTPDYVPIQFEDLCKSQRVSNGHPSTSGLKCGHHSGETGLGGSTGLPNGSPNTHFLDKSTVGSTFKGSEAQNEWSDTECFNINSLEVLPESPGDPSNYLSGGKMHSILWIFEAYAKFFYTNDQVTRMLTRVGNEVVLRMNELSAPQVPQLLLAFSQLSFRHSACLEMLLNEVANPRLGYKFTQKELAQLHFSIGAFALPASDYGVHRLDRTEYQRLVEAKGDPRSVIRAILTNEEAVPGPMYLELLTNPLESLKNVTITGTGAEGQVDSRSQGESRSATEGVSEERVKSELKEEEAVYVHIPTHIKRLVLELEGLEGGPGAEALAESLDSHISYNFKLD